MTQTKTSAHVGQVRRFDYQSDIFRAEYRLVEHLGGNRWLAEYLPPSDEAIEEILEGAILEHDKGYEYGYFGRGDKLELAEREIARRQADAGSTFTISIVSRDAWAAMF